MAMPARHVEHQDEQATDQAIRWSTHEEGRALFDRQARTLMGMSGDEFIRRWDAGEFRDIANTAGNRHITRLASLIPFGR
ncbi:MAG: hypothetical protein ACRDJW_18535 [Thermomicrobiales bacterium]